MRPTEEIQKRAIKEIVEKLENYKKLSQTRREQLLDVYRAFISFFEPKEEAWSTSFRVNKAHEVVEKILPRIIAKNPKWIVSIRNKKAFPTELQENTSEYANFIQDYLTYIWDEYSVIDPSRIWAKNMLIYGKGYAKVKYKYQVARVRNQTVGPELDDEGLPMMDEEGNERTKIKEEISEEVIGEYPTIDVKSWAHVYYDPRVLLLEDRPAFIEEIDGVRFSELWRKKDRKENPFFNLDKVREIGNIQAESTEDWISKINQINGIVQPEHAERMDLSNLTVQTYYGLFTLDEEKPEDERLYEITVVNRMVVVAFKEITQIPYEEIKCFEDTETAYARGFVEPILGLQEELNFKKNSASEYINKALTRQMIWSPNSTIDPSTINDPVIVADDAQRAVAQFVQLDKQEINPSYFQEQNDLERQIQSATFTVDTANPRSEQALTNTATGMRIKFFESNSVIDEVRKHFEAGLQKLAYKLLQCAFENMEDNIVFKKQGTEEYWEANKEILRDVLQKYSIKVEVNSSAYDYLENRREEAVALYNTLLQAKGAGEPVNTSTALIDVLETYEKPEPQKYIQPPNISQIAQGISGRPIPEENLRSTPNPAELTNQVAQGNLI